MTGRTHMSTAHLLGTLGYIDPLFVETLQYAQRTRTRALRLEASTSLPEASTPP